MDKSYELLMKTIELTDTAVKTFDKAGKRMVTMFIALCVTVVLVASMAICGYFFSDYDYAEVPEVINTNTNTNTNK